VRDPRVLEAMRRVPRHLFVPDSLEAVAHEDRWLPIAEDQHISQPYTVARMTELSQLDAKSRVLEIGTGTGYQAAVLAHVAGEVYSIEILEPLAREAARTLRRLGYTQVHLRRGDGYRGWPEAAPFDAILVTAAAPRVPQPLLEQLAPGGRLVIPVGEPEGYQEVELLVRTDTGYERRRIAPAYFVPMTGDVQDGNGR
jgi:protein-L-isoaspartate(D-aspartate) O-methyltransferase